MNIFSWYDSLTSGWQLIFGIVVLIIIFLIYFFFFYEEDEQKESAELNGLDPKKQELDYFGQNCKK